jgi:Leucine-rich repeat (LRR) protein
MEKYGPYGSKTYTELKDAIAINRGVYRLDLAYKPIEIKEYDKLYQLKDLQVLRLSTNSLQQYPKNFHQLTNLVFFASFNNKFSVFPDNLQAYQNLQYLELQHTQIDSIPSNLAYLGRLKTFKFGNTDDTLKLPTSFKYLKKLEDVVFENCVMDSFPKAVFQINSLKFLYLSNTNTHFISRHFERLPRLEVLIIENNKLLELPFDIYKAQKLRFISLRNNQLERLPDSISELTNLAFLDISGNRISAEEIEKLKILLPGCEIKF